MLITVVTLRDAPPVTFDLQACLDATFDVPLSADKPQIGVSGRHVDDYYQQVAHRNNPLDLVAARNWVDANVSFEATDGTHRVLLSGKNLTDEQDQFSALNFSPFLFNYTAAWLPGEARTCGLNYTYRFK